MAKIGLVTVLFKSDEVLPDFFSSIARQTHKDYILYLVDNSESEALLTGISLNLEWKMVRKQTVLIYFTGNGKDFG